MTPDQAAALSDFWQLNKRDSEYFITLVNLERASTPSLQKKLRERLHELRLINSDLPALEVGDVKMTYEQAARYFSTWYLSAIHRGIDIPGLKTAAAISSHLSLPLDVVEKALELLLEMKLVEREGSDWKCTDMGFHLNQHKELMRAYHAAMRDRAVFAFDRSLNGAIHFSGVLTVSKTDCITIYDAIKKLLTDVADIGISSEPQELMGITVDFFSI